MTEDHEDDEVAAEVRPAEGGSSRRIADGSTSRRRSRRPNPPARSRDPQIRRVRPDEGFTKRYWNICATVIFRSRGGIPGMRWVLIARFATPWIGVLCTRRRRPRTFVSEPYHSNSRPPGHQAPAAGLSDSVLSRDQIAWISPARLHRELRIPNSDCHGRARACPDGFRLQCQPGRPAVPRETRTKCMPYGQSRHTICSFHGRIRSNCGV